MQCSMCNSQSLTSIGDYLGTQYYRCKRCSAEQAGPALAPVNYEAPEASSNRYTRRVERLHREATKSARRGY